MAYENGEILVVGQQPAIPENLSNLLECVKRYLMRGHLHMNTWNFTTNSKENKFGTNAKIIRVVERGKTLRII